MTREPAGGRETGGREGTAVGRALTVGVGAATAGLGVDTVVDLGPLHPAAHGGYRLRLGLSGPEHDPVVASAEPLVGHLHRGAEKLFEVRDYRAVLTLANRHDWLAACCNEVTVALAVETMTGIEPPPRATWLRTLLCELNRAMAHLVFLAPLTRDAAGAATAATGAASRARHAVQQVLEEASGGRIHFMVNRIGGLRADVPDGWPHRVLAALDVVDDALPTLRESTVADERFVAAHRGVGVLAAADALALGVTGPVARASGVDIDLRRDDPVLTYGELAVVPVLATAGDALARVGCQLGEVALATALVRQCLPRLPAGPVDVRLPKSMTVPEGSVYTWTEAPLGVVGVYLSSRGEKTPWRLKLRAPSFGNIQALAALLPGTPLRALGTVLASFSVVVGDVDR